MQDYALAHEASIRKLYKQLFGEELEHVTPSHDNTVNKEEGLEHGRIEHRQMKSVVLSPEMLG